MNETTDFSAAFAPLWRRKWLILAVAILVGVGSYLYYKRQPPVYAATTQVYLANGAEEQAQLGTGAGGKRAGAPNPTTQAALINSSVIKEAVHDQLRQGPRTPAVRGALKGKATAKASEKSEFVTISGEAHSARGAALLVNATAQAYIKRQNDHYRVQVETAIALAHKQLRKLDAGQLESLIASDSPSSSKGQASSKGLSSSAALQAATLSAKINQLEADLGVAQVTQVDPAKPRQSVLVSPHPKSNAIFGFAIGLVLATFAAYALGRLDRRLRSLAAVEDAFQTQVLTALRAVKHPLIVRDGHPATAYVLREALWRLQTTLQVGGNGAENGGAPENDGRGRGPRTILCVSADPGDGKSTLVAALALTWSEAGERAAVVEADFRRPVQSELLHLSGSHGLADVLTGALTLEQALQTVSFARPDVGVGATHLPLPVASGGAVAAGGATTVLSTAGSLSVLIGGTKIANPPALLGNPATAELVRSLATEFDHVLIDAPSPLQVSDAMLLLAAVDAIVIVARVGHTRKTSAQRLIALLQSTPSAPVLGVVVNGVSPADLRKYGIHADVGWRERGLRHTLLGR
jgi:Mrp family chromosome partitioning ATPase/capsular polysaccharide biosynthesis protein